LLADDAVRYEDPTWINENEIIYSSNEANGKDFFIYHYDIAAKKRTLLVEKKGYNMIGDALSKDDFLFYTYESNFKTVPYHFHGGKAHRIKVSDENKRYFPVAFFEGGILMKTNEKSDMEYLEIIKENSKTTLFEDKWGVESVAVDRISRDEAVFCTNEEGYSRCFHYKKGKIEPLDFGRSLVGLNSLKNGKLVLKVSSEGGIPQPQVFDLTAKTTLKFGYFNANGIDVTLFAAPVLRKVKSFDGEEIPYFIYLPKTGKAPYPTIVYFHGGPEGQFRPGFTTQFQYYLSKGIAIVAPNVRGSSGYGRRYMDLDNYKLRMNSVKDGGAILEDLVKSGLSKPNRFIASGGSYGGFMTVASMAQFAVTTSAGSTMSESLTLSISLKILQITGVICAKPNTVLSRTANF
ncbi:S9 family peptidase, partial [bacterium]|nr:S9 family peptidase [bacterium]